MESFDEDVEYIFPKTVLIQHVPVEEQHYLRNPSKTSGSNETLFYVGQLTEKQKLDYTIYIKWILSYLDTMQTCFFQRLNKFTV